MNSRLFRAYTEASGLPPNVEIELDRSESTMSARPTTAPMAIPFPSPLAHTIASGRTPKDSMPQNDSPVRPNPVWTSSAMNGMPHSSRIRFTIGKYSGGGVTNPPTPWIGSAIMAAGSPVVVVSMTFWRSSAQATPQSGYFTFSGLNDDADQPLFPVIPMAPNERPW